MEKETKKNLSGKERLGEIIDVLKRNDLFGGMNPSKFRTILEELGPTFVKIGQILSNRPDLISEEYTEELSKLRNQVNPMPYQEVLSIISASCDQKLFQTFLNIEPTPIGSASIAQVHKATLQNGDLVVIKVQRPDIKEKMTTDIKLLKKALSVVQAEKIFKNIVSFDDVLDELLNTSIEEMNFTIEASHIEEFYRGNKEFKYIKVPKVYKKLSSEKVLVMEYIEGYQINDLPSLINDGYDLEEISTRLADNYIYQALDLGYFHADPHPDNIIITDGKIGYIDFGMMGRLNERNKNILKKCLYAIFTNDIKEVERNLLIIGDVTGEVNHSKLCQDLNLILEKNKTSSIKDINIAVFASDLMRILGDNNIHLPKDITMLVRGIVVLEGTLEIVNPSINLMQVLKNRIKILDYQKILNKETLAKEAINTVNSLASLNRLPYDLHRIISETSKGETKVNIEVVDLNKHVDRIEKMIHRIVVAFLDVAFILGASLLATNGIETTEQQFLFFLYISVGFCFTVWLFIKMYLDKLNRKK